MSYKTTCRERYNRYVNERRLATPQFCSLDDDNGDPINNAAICSNVDDCGDLWDGVCEECPLLAAVGPGPCMNADETR